MAKILIDARLYGLEHSGIGRYLINLLAVLQKLDKENTYVVLLRKSYYDKLKLPDNWKKIKAYFRHYTIEEQIKLPRIINRIKPDLVHFPHINYPYFNEFKYVMTVHDLTMQRQGINASKLSWMQYFVKRFFFLIIARKGISNARIIITPTKSVKEDLVSFYRISGKNILTINEGFDELLLNSKNTRSDVLKKFDLKKNSYFLYVGKAYPHKNLNVMIDAIKLFNDRENIKVVIAGLNDEFKDKLFEYVRLRGVEKRVIMTGFVKDDELADLYKNSIAFVYPSLSEGFGLQGVEAMANGTLLIASDIDVFREVYNNYALYFDPKDERSLQKVMLNAIDMPNRERSARIKKAKNFVKKYSWRKMAEKTLEVYAGVLNNRYK